MTAPDLPRENAGPGDEYDGDIESIVMPPDVRAAAEERIAAAVKKYGASAAPVDD